MGTSECHHHGLRPVSVHLLRPDQGKARLTLRDRCSAHKSDLEDAKMALENAKKSMDMLAKDEALKARVENIS